MKPTQETFGSYITWSKDLITECFLPVFGSSSLLCVTGVDRVSAHRDSAPLWKN